MSVTISDSLAGRRALVTGGSRGAGAAIVSRLTEGGATVMTTARAMPDGYPDPGLFVTADISTPGGAQTVIDRVDERFGVLDILVNAAGGSHAGSGGFAALSDAQWQDELNLNLLSIGTGDDAAHQPSSGRWEGVSWSVCISIGIRFLRCA